MIESQPPPDRSLWKRVFLSEDELRLRAGWRLTIHTILYNLLVVCIAIPLAFPILYLKISPMNLLLNGAVALFAVTVSVFLARRFLDKRSFSSLGLSVDRWFLPDILAGVLITFVIMGFIYVFESILGWLTFDGFTWETDAFINVILNTLFYLGAFVLGAWNEELLFRGYRLQNIAAGLNPAWGVILSSLWFGIAHLLNPNAEARIFVATGIFLAGIFFAFSYFTTRQLWLPIGLHLGWNFFEGVVFGFPVSGLDIYHLSRITVQGPVTWTGGAFGPEAGLVVLPGLILGAILIYVYTKFVRNPNNA